MKPLIVVAFLAVFAPFVAAQDSGPVVVPPDAPVAAPVEPAKIENLKDRLAGNAWDRLTASPNFHLLDNATVGYCYDAIHKQGLGCATTSVYQKYYISADLGAAGGKAPNSASSNIQSYQGFPIFALNFHAGQLFAAKVPEFDKVVSQFGDKNASLAQNCVVGGWFARDFHEGWWRGGAFASFKFGTVTN